MKQLAFILIVQFSMFDAFAQWINLGLNGFQVNDLTIYSDTIYASTDDGIYKKHIFSADTTWISCGKQDHYIVQTLVENYQSFISLIQLGLSNTTQIYKSENAGSTFYLMNPDTSNPNSYQFLDHVAHPANNYDTLYFLNHQLKTNDGGITWESIDYTPNADRFIVVNPANHSQLIIGGEAGYFNAYLQVSSDFGNMWSSPSMNSFFGGDNAIHDLAIDDSVWYAAGEGIIAKSTDGGENWSQLLNLWSSNSLFSLYYTNIEFSPVNKNLLYVTGLNPFDSNKVPLLYSENQGASWDSVFYNSAISDQKIRCMTVKNTGNIDNVFIGGNGVYLYKKILSQVIQHTNDLNLTVYPNPANDQLFIQTDKAISDINIYDVFGCQVFAKQTKENIIKLYGLPCGLYFITFTIENKRITRKFIKEE